MRGRSVAPPARGQHESESPTVFVGHEVDLGSATAARATYGLGVGPPFRLRPSGAPWLWCCRSVQAARYRLNQPGQHALPDISPRPAVIAIVECCRRTVAGRAILPASAVAQDVRDPADHPPIVGATCTRLVGGQHWLHRRPSTIRQPELSSHHQNSAQRRV